jgi:hypothetical protein
MNQEHWDEIGRYMALSPEQRRAADCAKYRYLPADELMLSAGYVQEWLGLWQHRPLPAMWPLYEVAFYSESGTCRLSYCEAAGTGWQRHFAQVVTSEEQLLQFLREHQWPAPPLPVPEPPADVILLRRIEAEPERVYAEAHSYGPAGVPDGEQRLLLQELYELGYFDVWQNKPVSHGAAARPQYFPQGSYQITEAGRRYLRHFTGHYSEQS